MVSILKNIKYVIKVILGKELILKYNRNKKIKWFGNKNAGFYALTDNLDKNSIVYSFGIGEDISFDEEIIAQYNCTVFGFDPTPKSINYMKLNNTKIKFYEYGVYSYDGNIKFYLPKDSSNVSGTIFNRWKYNENKLPPINVPVKKFSTITKELGHKIVDIVKIDIEGSEYEILDDVLNSGVKINQILIEFHHRFPEIGIKKTKKAIEKLKSYGYELIAVSESREEYTFKYSRSIIN